jgi:acetylglutamate kinase
MLELSPGHVLETHESGISALNLRSDRAQLLGRGLLTRYDELWLERAEGILLSMAPLGTTLTTVSVASPRSLVRELFTVRGEGTLVKLGSVVERFFGYRDVDVERLRLLLEESFGRKVKDAFFAREPERLYLEQTYRGVALLEPAPYATYLSKFAVLPLARGEGLGQDLWWEMVKDTPRLFWRSRPDNPINGFYTAVCDGLHRAARFHVFYRGVEPELAPELVRAALDKPGDFE